MAVASLLAFVPVFNFFCNTGVKRLGLGMILSLTFRENAKLFTAAAAFYISGFVLCGLNATVYLQVLSFDYRDYEELIQMNY